MTAHVVRSDAEAIDAAREIARVLAPGSAARDRAATLPVAEVEALARSGLLGITVPRRFGGAQISVETLVRVFQIISAADPAIGQLPQNHFVFLEAILQDGSADQQEFFCSEVLAGALFGNAQAERGGRSALDLATRLTRAAGGGFRLSGTKYYCTGAQLARWLPVAAIDELGRQVLAYVPRDAPGVEIRSDWNAMGQRVTFSGTAVLDKVAVPERHVVPHWQLFQRPSVFHGFSALLHAAIDVGIAENALADGVAAVRGRGRPRLGAQVARAVDDPLAIYRIGQLSAKFHASEQLVRRAARLIDEVAGGLDRERAARVAVAVSEAKAFAEDVAIEITNELFALAGTAATDRDLDLDRHWRNARTHTVHDANQWRYHSVGNYVLNGIHPAPPARRPAERDGQAGASAAAPEDRVAVSDPHPNGTVPPVSGLF